MTIPQIRYETYIIQGQLIMNPVGIQYHEETKEHAAEFQLPSGTTAYGSAMYVYYENNLRAALPNADRVSFARSKLEQFVALATYVKQKTLDDAIEGLTKNYEQSGLPKTELCATTELDETTKKGIVTQLMEYRLQENLMQPARKIKGLWAILEPAQKEELKPTLIEYAKRYQELKPAVPKASQCAQESAKIIEKILTAEGG